MGKMTSTPRRGLSRRGFLKHAGASLAAAPLLPACSNSSIPASAPASGDARVSADNPFQHGVASGDPLSDRVMFWTRVSTAADSLVVDLAIYRDPELSLFVTGTRATATAARDYTVKLDVAGLEPGTTYYYRFSAGGFDSPIGRTRTAPLGGVDQLRFGVVSCSSYAHGYFNAYRHLAARADIDAILHLGDYIYEYGTNEYGNVRPYEPAHEMITLEDYRTRHAYYKQEPDLMELHRQFPFITTWDDHESTDNSWRDSAVNHTEGEEGVWAIRKAWAQQAYDEWMPIRYPETGRTEKIWRRFNYGDLADIFVLDTRLYDRDEPDGIPADPAVAKDPARRMLGPEQMNWLLDGLASSSAQWKLIAQQVVFHQWQLVPGAQATGGGTQLNGDAWDGYQAERQQIINALRDHSIQNVVVLTGDVHSSWAADITDDPNNPLAYNPATGDGSVAVEFVTTSVTSPFAIDIPEGQQTFLANNPHIRYTDWDEKGYLLLNLSNAEVTGEYWYVSEHTTPGGTESFALSYRSESGSQRLQPLPGTSPTAGRNNADPLAP